MKIIHQYDQKHLRAKLVYQLDPDTKKLARNIEKKIFHDHKTVKFPVVFNQTCIYIYIYIYIYI